MATQEKTHGTAILTCRNHPTYRWTHTKYNLPGSERHFIGNGVLMFDGEDGGKPACPFNMNAEQLARRPGEYQREFLSIYTPECNCDFEDLIFLRWSD